MTTSAAPSARRRTAAVLAGSAVLTATALAGSASPALAGKTPSPTPTTTTTSSDFSTLHNVGAVVGAHTAYKTYGITGKGVDVALIDTGVSPVPGLTSGNVINGPDLSFDSQEPSLRHLDGYGHGTHMAGIIVGRDVPQTMPSRYVDSTRFTGIAPDARLVSVKVGAADGAVDVTQVLAALNWVAEHGQKDGLNIRVVNLSYGTDTTQHYLVDPLAHAVEALVRKGVVVVAAGGNDGSDKTYLGMPAQSPSVIAVGGDDPRGTVAAKDDTVPAFANRGDNKRNVDFVAPAVSVQSLRVPGSYADQAFPGARVGDRFFKGSGTSQAAAVVSGAAALYLQKHPTATPAQVKGALSATAMNMTDGTAATRGSGVVNIGTALAKTGDYASKEEPTTGTGSLELSRGSTHVVDYADDTSTTPVVLEGERDIFGLDFNTRSWAEQTTAGRTWSADGSWYGRTWTGAGWAGESWTGRTWTGRTWTGSGWDGGSWDGRTWTGRTWTGRTWTGDDWSGTEAWQ